jgi:hypothetical protein
MARKYTKQSDYWTKFNKSNNLEGLAMSQAYQEDYTPELLGESFYTSDASYKERLYRLESNTCRHFRRS